MEERKITTLQKVERIFFKAQGNDKQYFLMNLLATLCNVSNINLKDQHVLH